jgi:hypothetical protein
VKTGLSGGVELSEHVAEGGRPSPLASGYAPIVVIVFSHRVLEQAFRVGPRPTLIASMRDLAEHCPQLLRPIQKRLMATIWQMLAGTKAATASTPSDAAFDQSELYAVPQSYSFPPVMPPSS